MLVGASGMNQTLTDIRTALKSRAMEVEVVKRKTDQAVRRQQAAGCWSAIWAIFTRRRDSSYTAGASAEAGDGARKAGGLFRKPVTAASKLEGVLRSLEAKLEQLDTRALQHKEEALKANAAGNKQAALIQVKKKRHAEKQREGLLQTVLAVQAQADALEQADLQKEVAAALQATNKTFKKKGLLKNAESAVEGAVETRDMSDELSVVMSELGGHGDHDDDELLAELEAMVGEGEPPPPAPKASTPAEEAAKAAAALAEKHRHFDELEAMRAILPTVPKGSIEKQGLLAR